MIAKRFRTGLARGLFFGLVYAWADTLGTFFLTRDMMAFDPFTRMTVSIALMSLLFCVVTGGILSVLGGRFLESPTRHIHAMVVSTILMVWIASPEFDLILGLALFPVGLAHWTALLLNRLARSHRTKALAAVIPALLVLWYGGLSLGRPPRLDRTVDPNRPVPAASLPNILWVVFDTTRFDHLSVYGYSRDTTPNLAKLAAGGTVFDRAYATAPWTVASHASMFTGKFSSQHWCNHEHLYLDDIHLTLSKVLSDAGYDTAAYAGNPWLDDVTALIRNFHEVQPSWRAYNLNNIFAIGRIRILMTPGGQDKGAQESNAAFQKLLEARKPGGRPFFAFINYFEPHGPYHQIPHEDAYRFLPAGVTPERADEVSRLFMSRSMFATDYEPSQEELEIAHAVYDGAIYNTDRRLGELIEMLRQADELENTLVIMNADHGEMFGEHGVSSHDRALYDALVHVPMVMHWPGKVPAGQRIDNPVQLIDVFPTVLEYTNLTSRLPKDVRGTSLIPTLAGGGDPERPVFAEYFRTHMRPLRKEIARMGFDPETFRLKSVQVRDLRLIRGPGFEELYDLSTDPAENKNLINERREEAAMLRSLLDRFIRDNPDHGPSKDSPVANNTSRSR